MLAVSPRGPPTAGSSATRMVSVVSVYYAGYAVRSAMTARPPRLTAIDLRARLASPSRFAPFVAVFPPSGLPAAECASV